MVVFNALELLKCLTMYDISAKINFNIPFRFGEKNFEIWIVLSGELPASKGYYRTFELSPRFSSLLYNSTPKRYFLMPLNY